MSEHHHPLSLGVDTGGTFTDAVLVDHQHEVVVASAKALTTYHDLSVGIREAIEAVVTTDDLSRRIQLVGLSTTLATNSIVEGRGGEVGLIMIGYDQRLMDAYRLHAGLATQHYAFVSGGHDEAGQERQPLDEDALREAVRRFSDSVDSIAISGYFGVRNPEHEITARAIVTEQTAERASGPLPVTCGHELTSKLDSIRRAMTAVLNARLIPLLQDLIQTLRQVLDEHGIRAPLMIVRGDGSLVQSSWAINRPVETILSGPAASAVGARYLLGNNDMWVVDVGGTTTDIALLEKGLPKLNPFGAHVGSWQTMVEAIDLRTIGLGGDSRVRLRRADDRHVPVDIGPARAIPLCALAHAHEGVAAALQAQLNGPPRDGYAARFVTLRTRATHALSERDALLVDFLRAGPRTLDELSRHDILTYNLSTQIASLTTRGIIIESAFTPTDALHVLGLFNRWSTEASRMAAELLTRDTSMTAHEFAELVVYECSRRIAENLILCAVDVPHDPAPHPNKTPGLAQRMIDRIVGRSTSQEFGLSFSLNRPITAIGAPVQAYLPMASRLLNTNCAISEHAGVANAVGAVAGMVVERIPVLIQPIEVDGEARYRVHLTDSTRDCEELEDAVELARRIVTPIADSRAVDAGADHVEVTMDRTDERASSTHGTDDLYLGTKLVFAAMGRPRALHAGAPERVSP